MEPVHGVWIQQPTGGMGHGRGSGFRMNKEDRKEILKEEVEYLEEDLKAIREELSELQS